MPFQEVMISHQLEDQFLRYADFSPWYNFGVVHTGQCAEDTQSLKLEKKVTKTYQNQKK